MQNNLASVFWLDNFNQSNILIDCKLYAWGFYSHHNLLIKNTNASVQNIYTFQRNTRQGLNASPLSQLSSRIRSMNTAHTRLSAESRHEHYQLCAHRSLCLHKTVLSSQFLAPRNSVVGAASFFGSFCFRFFESFCLRLDDTVALAGCLTGNTQPATSFFVTLIKAQRLIQKFDCL